MVGRTEKREAVKSVDVDNRLSEVFNSHRKYIAESDITEPVEEQVRSAEVDNSDWLSQFISNKPSQLDKGLHDGHLQSNASFVLTKDEIRPFWCTSDDKHAITSWKRSRSALAKDCQKQRKLATRKAIRR